MKSDNLNIRGLKCFLDIDIPFRELTVLAGGNSVGKSSVIQSLLLIRLAAERAGMTPRTVPLNGDYVLGLGNSFDVINSKAPSDNISIDFSVSGSQQVAVLNADSLEAQVYLGIASVSAPIASRDVPWYNPITAPNFHYLHAERLGPRPFYGVSNADRNVGCRGEYTIALLSSSAADTQQFDVPAKLRFPDTKNPRLSYQTEQWMSYIIPGVEIDSQKIREINQAFVQYGGNTPYNVGFGISYILPIIVSGLIAGAGEMLIVENPEAHLHPSGQSRIGRFLALVAAAGVKVLVETHSEHIINGVRIAALEQLIDHKDVVFNFFDKPQGEVNAMPNVHTILLNEQADLAAWPKGFFDQQQEDIARIFKLRKRLKNDPI